MEKIDRKFPLRTIVEVEWADAAVLGQWRKQEEYEKQGDLICRTAGYLLKRDRQAVIILQSQNQEGKLSDSMMIPRGMIKRIRRLK